MAMFETRPVGKRDRRAGFLVAAAILALGWSIWSTSQVPADPATPPDAAFGEPQVAVTAALVDPHFVATRALTDFGLEIGARYVAVRILATAELDVDIRAERDVVLGDDPGLCLVGPFAQPDYAGLSEPCWGSPDLGRALRSRLPVDGAGRRFLPAGRTVTLRAPVMRDPARCDYPPGDWQLVVDLSRIVDDQETRLHVPPVQLVLPPLTIGPLPMIVPTNYCGLANVAFVEQGEPLVLTGAAGSPIPATP
jgi:hypothetical protein